MSGLQLLAPLGLLALAGVPLIVFFHMRHTTPIERSAPTLRFWRMVTPVPTDEARLRRPPLSLLLVLQVLAVSALGLALARPAITGAWAGLGGAAEPNHLVFVLDGSTSMTATDTEDGQQRFEYAKSQMIQRIEDTTDGDVVTVLILGSSIQSFEAGDRAGMHALTEQLAVLPLPGGRADLNTALSLASNLLLPGMNNHVIVLTDGAVSADPAVTASVGAPVELVQAGQANTPNLAIVQLSASASGANANGTTLFARLANFGGNNVDTTLSLLADNIEVQSSRISIPAGATIDFSSNPLPPGVSRARLVLQTSDALLADDTAEVILSGQSDLAQRILLVSDTPLILQRALSALPGAQVTTISTTEHLSGNIEGGPYDLLVFEDYTPENANEITAPVVFVHPPVDGLLPAKGVMTTSSVQHLRPDDPLLRGVDLTGLTFGETPIHMLGPNDTEVVTGENGPLLYRGQLPEIDEPMVVLAFGLQDTAFPQRIAFPILMTNIVQTLAPAALPAAVVLGDPLVLQPRAGVQTIRITTPAGSVSDSPVATDASGTTEAVIFTDTGMAGEYAVQELDKGGATIASGIFVIDAGHPTESNLTANPDLPAILATAQTSSNTDTIQKRLGDLWPLLAMLALGLLAVEWFWVMRSAHSRGPFHTPKRARI